MEKTYVLLEVTHKAPVPLIAEKAAQRTWSLQGVDDCTVVWTSQNPQPSPVPLPGVRPSLL